MIDIKRRDTVMAVNMPDILIEVEAHNYPERVGNENQMALEIKEAADGFLENRSTQPDIVVLVKLVTMGVAAPSKSSG